MARVAEKTRLNIYANNKGADRPARPRRLISAFVVRCSSFLSTKKRLTNLNGEQNDTWDLLVSHRICHFRAIQPFDYLWQPFLHKFDKEPNSYSFAILYGQHAMAYVALKSYQLCLISCQNICCGYSLEAPPRGASNEYPQHMFSWRNKKNINIFG